MILEIKTGKDPNNVVRKYFKDRDDMRSVGVFSGLGNSYRLFEDDGETEIPLYIKKAKLVVEEKDVESLDDFLSQGE